MITKRAKFVATSAILSLGFVGINFLEGNARFLGIGILTLLTALLFLWSLWEGIGLNSTLLTLILPTLFTLGVGLFWFLLPATTYARIPIVIFYGIGLYALSLTANIYTVSAIRTIALMRAAKGVGFILTLVVTFLVFDAIFSLRALPYITAPLVFGSAYLLFIQGLWSSVLETTFDKRIFVNSLFYALALAQATVLLFFWPVTVVVGSLFLTVGMYVLLGLGQAQIEKRLFKVTVRDYLIVGLIVFIAMFFATRWGG